MIRSRLIRMDVLFLIVAIGWFFVPAGSLRDGFLGAASAIFLLSVMSHVKYYKLNKKFY